MTSPNPLSKSPLSPRAANANTPKHVTRTERSTFPKSPAFDIHQDTENLPDGRRTPEDLDDTISHRSTKPYLSPSKSRSPRKADPEAPPPTPLTEDALRENEGLTRAINMMDGGDSIVDLYSGHDTTSIAGTAAGYPGMDDTCFSTFSAVPDTDMTLFAQKGQSPNKSSSPAKRSREAQYASAVPTPRTTGRSTPATSRRPVYDDCSPSPTPRRPKSSRDADTTNLILDFTEQFNAFSGTSFSHQTRPTPRKFNTQPDLAAFAASKRASPSKYPPSTPSRASNLANLLDFDLPPAPTPRSIPTITARELESLKSSFLSQISSLRATLNGREAEVNSLKDAVGDAERRVGEAQEEIRDQRGQKESLQAEKDDWQTRNKEMQGVLRSVKEEILHEQHEHERLQQRLEASEKMREETETKLVEADSKVAGLQAAAAAAAPPSTAGSEGQIASGESANGNNAAVEAAVEKVARELHGLYKSKHETKVSALKKSYEARWEKKIMGLESQIRDLNHENEELRIARDATLSNVVAPGPHHHPGDDLVSSEDENKQAAEGDQQEQKARLEALSQQIQGFRHENTTLQQQLETERREMAELVKATEEMMQLSLHSNPSSAAANSGRGEEAPNANSASHRSGNLPKTSSGGNWKQSSIGSAGESRIGRMAATGSGLGSTRSGIMNNIERMGRGRAVD
ncbi:MAG: hypothetical protein LQ349_004135 [Xanthoria aureola]|nr:MAG: hypothetical protein LQ349_004135 [Xanthoria aureola]